MNNFFSAGLLTISVIALSGCKESVDLKSGTYSSSHTGDATSTTTQTNSHAPTSIIVTTPPVTVIRVVNVTNTETSNGTNTDTGKDSGPTTDTGTDTGTDSGPTTDTGTDTGTDSGPTTDTGTDTGTDSGPTTDTGTDTDTGSDSDPTTDTGTDTASACEAFPDAITEFVRVQLHYGLLSDASFIPGETGGLDTLTVTADAIQGATELSLDSTVLLKPGQLITYVGTNGHNRVAEIGEVFEDRVTITSGAGLETAISAGSKISNFYYDPTHPNKNGYRAVADFGVRSAFPIAAGQTHVLLGDSWFDDQQPSGSAEFEKQLNVRLPGSTIINVGIGGNTLCDLINRFDTDVTPNNPDYVWVNSSINDYFAGVSSAYFKTRIQYLISKIQALGAKAIVYDSAPSGGNDSGGSDTRRNLSYRYSGVLLDLFNDTQEP